MSGVARRHAEPRDRRDTTRDEGAPKSGRFRKPAGALDIGLIEVELPDESERIAVPGSPHALVFHRKLMVRIFPDEQGYRCEIPRLRIARGAETKEKAVAAVAAALREETAALLGTLSHELKYEELERKRVLLGNIDVLGSGLARSVPTIPSTSEALFFLDALQVITSPDNDGWSCSIPELETSRRGATEDEALTALADALRDEAQRLLRTPSHTLDPSARERKGLLLGNIDVVASKIAESLGEHTWVLGQIDRDSAGQRWFQEVGSHGGRYPFAPELAGDLPEDCFLRMAKILVGAAGEPTGPVAELGPPLDDDPERIRAEWERLGDAGG